MTGIVAQSAIRFRSRRRQIGGFALGSIVVAQMEAAVFVIIAASATALTQEREILSTELPSRSVSVSITQALGIGVTLAVISGVLALWLNWRQARAAAQVGFDAQRRVIEAFAKADWEYQADQRGGGLQATLTLALSETRQFQALTTYIRGIATVVVYSLSALLVDVRAAFVVMGMGLVLALIVGPLRSRTRVASRSMNRQTVDFNQDVTEIGTRALDLRAFRAWPSATRWLERQADAVARSRSRTGALSGAVPVIYQFGGLVLVLAVLMVASGGAGSVASWAATGLLLLRTVQYGQSVQASLQVLAETVPALEILDHERTPPPPSVRFGEVELRGATRVTLDHVAYTYPGAHSPALEDVSGSFGVGEVVGIAGPSGGGKSTLAQVMLRVRQPTYGAVLVDGVAANEFTENSWFETLAFVPQQPILLRGTLLENVTYGDAGIPPVSAESALRQAGLGQLLEELPGGLDCPIGPGNRNLSGGQVQRIGIARALARNPSVLILDEPTSALDNQSEAAVHDAIDRLRKDGSRLVIVIAHRATTLDMCDRIVWLRGGVSEPVARGADLDVPLDAEEGKCRIDQSRL